jgi:hypothetical protein
MGNPEVGAAGERWPAETFEEVLRYSVPLPTSFTEEEVRRYGAECAKVMVANDRAAVHVALDHLAREFVQADRPNIAKRVHETAKALAERHLPD